jgi:hypothetical protein
VKNIARIALVDYWISTATIIVHYYGYTYLILAPIIESMQENIHKRKMGGKPYARKANKSYRLKCGLKLKINKIIKASEQKGYFIIRNVVLKDDAINCISQRPPDSSFMPLQGANRKYDRTGHQHFTDLIRNLTVRFRWPINGSVYDERTQKFGKFYKLVAECLGMADIFVNEHDRIIFHSDKLDVSTSVCM